MRLLTLVIVLGLVIGAAAQGPSFEVASIHPGKENSEINPIRSVPQPGGRWLAENVSAMRLLTDATGYTHPGQIVGGPALGGGTRYNLPEWIYREPWTIEAKAADAAPVPVLRQMLLTLMAERFGLRYHIERRAFDALAIIRAHSTRLGPGVTPASVDCTGWAAATERGEQASRPPSPSRERLACGVRLTRLTPDASIMRFGGVGASSAQLVDLLDSHVSAALGVRGMPVVDRTGLDERFDIDLTFRTVPLTVNPADTPDDDPILQALEKQLGLKVERRTEMLDVMVIDQIARPTPN